MRLKRGVHYRVKTLPSGRRVRQAILNDKVIETSTLRRRKTKSGKRLARARRRRGR